MVNKTFEFDKRFAGQPEFKEKALKPAVAILRNAGFFNLGIAIALPLCCYSEAYLVLKFLLGFVVSAGIVGKLTLPGKTGWGAFALQTVGGIVALIFVVSCSHNIVAK